MRKRTKTLRIGLTLFWITCTLGCASLLIASVPSLENRTLRISPDIAGFEYQYEVCAKKFLGMCTKTAMHKDVYDLTDSAVRRRLIDMGFVAQVRQRAGR